MASLQFIFGDFSEEEQVIFKESSTSSVEFPSSWPKYDNDDAVKDTQRLSSIEDTSISFIVMENGPTYKDENHNHVPKQQKLIAKKDSIKIQSGLPTSGISPEKSELLVNGTAELKIETDQLNDDKRFESVQNGQVENKTIAVNGETSPEHDEIKTEKMDSTTDLTPTDETDIDKDNAQVSKSPAQSPPASTTKPTSWAALFSGTPQPTKPTKASNVSVSASTLKPTPVNTTPKDSLQPKKKHHAGIVQNGVPVKLKSEVVDVKSDPFSKQLAAHIAKNEIVYKSPGLTPQGYINSSNWCYVNATLQALITSSPFCHLMRSLPSRQASDYIDIISTSTPILDSFVRLVKELKPLPKKNHQRQNKDQIQQNVPCEPKYIYEMLATIKSKFSERGRQEDAEEFLSCVLNGLHEEMMKVTAHHDVKNTQAQNNEESVPKSSSVEMEGYEGLAHDQEPADESNEEGDQWEEVTTKNKSSLMRRADISKTPVSDIFRGELRSDLCQGQGRQRSTATLEPFFTLPLDIHDHKTWSVADALEHLTRMETVQDFSNPKTKEKVEATRKLTLETLPAVLILHLKRFVYDKEGGLLKIGKEVQYHTDLVIGKELMSKSSKKLSQDKRTYKLYAVVYHHGKEATGGHYTADVFHDGMNCWLRIDDQHIKNTNVHEVVRHNPQRTAYLLYYKRTDLMAV